MRGTYKALAEKYLLINENDHNGVPSYEDALVYPGDYKLHVTTVIDFDYEGREVDRPVYKLTHKLYHEYEETVYNPDDMEAILYAFELHNPKGIIG
jgi:hypothetical protein